jgi:leucyl-tRNA synthetase
LGPHEDTIAWNSNSVVGVKRFLDRVWSWVCSAPIYGQPGKADKSARYTDSDKTIRAINKLTKKITEDIENFHFNTSISAFMEFHNEIKDEPVSAESVKTFLKLLYPFAPHISEELNQLVPVLRGRPFDKTQGALSLPNRRAKREQSLQQEEWPKFDPAMIVDQSVEIVVQVNGKVKGKITVPSGSDEAAVKKMSMDLPTVKILLGGETIKRVVFVPNRLVNLVV